VQVGYNDRKLVTVMAHAGALEVFTSTGELLAALDTGGAMSFDPGAGGAGSGGGSASGAGGSGSGGTGSGSGGAGGLAPTTFKGKLILSEGKYYVISGGQTYQITSTNLNLAKYVGKVIIVKGGVTKVGSTSVIAVIGATGVGGLSTGAITALALTGAGGLTVTGLAAAGTFSAPCDCSTP